MFEHHVVAGEGNVFHSVGTGIGLGVNSEINKVSSLFYGVEVSTVRSSVVFDGAQNLFSNSTVKVPILYHFKLLPNTKSALIFRLGPVVEIQSAAISGTSVGNTNAYKYSRHQKAGVFPLFKAGLGFDLTTEKKRDLMFFLNIQQGFIESSSYKIETSAPVSVTEYSTKGSYFSLEFCWSLFRGKI